MAKPTFFDYPTFRETKIPKVRLAHWKPVTTYTQYRWLVQALIERSYTDDWNLQNVIIWKFRDLGARALEALPRLREIEREAEERTAGFATEAIAAIEADGEE